jgi:two-component system, OmpR family, phosphate regulon sensor histidine kinase PhoR
LAEQIIEHPVLAKLKQIGTTGRLASILVLLVMLPAIFFSVYEFTTLSRSETLIGDVYRQQLDVVLFSLNQYAWDIADSWANRINGDLSTSASARKDLTSLFIPFLNENSGIRCLFIADSLVTRAQLLYPRAQVNTGDNITIGDVTASLKEQSLVLGRLFRYQATGYRKIDPLFVGDKSGGKSLALVFIAGRQGRAPRIVGIVIDAERFVRDVLGRKMVEAAGDNFLLTVNRKNSGQVIYATGELLPGEARQTKDLWLFPDYTIGIRLRGQTIDEVVRARFYRNLLLIGLLNIVLIAGVWVVYRTVRRDIELAQLKSDFVSNVSHEIKTPLALIRMFAETLQLKRVKSEAKKQEYYDTIVQETERLTRLINNILNFSRMEAGKKEYRMEPVDLNTIVRDVVKNYRTHLESEGFEISIRITDDLPVIDADTGALAEALLNVIDNSVKYSRTKKYLNIVTGREGLSVFVEIEDHGIGIDPRQQKKIFEKFYRVSSGLVDSTKGTGLGLALVKHIIDAHKGVITLRSEVGKGSTFRMSFPASVNQKT